MRIENKTAWRTEPIRALLERVLAEEIPDPQKRAAVHVTLLNSRQRRLGSMKGSAKLGGTEVTLRLPPGWRAGLTFPDGTDIAMRLAHLAAHEYAHLRGLKHSDMRGSPRYRPQNANELRQAFGWAKGLECLQRDAAEEARCTPLHPLAALPRGGCKS